MQKGGPNTGSYRLLTGDRGNVIEVNRILYGNFTTITGSHACHRVLYRCKTGVNRGETPPFTLKQPYKSV